MSKFFVRVAHPKDKRWQLFLKAQPSAENGYDIVEAGLQLVGETAPALSIDHEKLDFIEVLGFDPAEVRMEIEDYLEKEKTSYAI